MSTHIRAAHSGDATPLHAWIDESVHLDHADGLYIMAAAVAEAAICDPLRDELRSLVRPPRPRLHWRDEQPKDRRKIAEAISGFDLINVVVVGHPVENKKQERSRRKCTERLLHVLNDFGVTRAFLESRTSTLNRRDLAMIEAMRGAQTIPPGLRVDFGYPLDEPMLWVPDAVAGAVGAAEKGNPEYRGPLERACSTNIGSNTRATCSDSAKAGSRHAAGVPAQLPSHPAGGGHICKCAPSDHAPQRDTQHEPRDARVVAPLKRPQPDDFRRSGAADCGM